MRARDILGINSRFLEYIKPLNSRANLSFADNKLKAKKYLEARGIRVPKLVATFRDSTQLSMDRVKDLPGDIVVKPNNGSRGQGIVVLGQKKKSGWVSVGGELFTYQDMLTHLSNTIQGAYSMAGYQDTAMIEKRIVTHPDLERICYKGLPDIRIIVFNMVPIIAMMRIPTAESDGKANMDAGGVGAGIDMSKGELTYLAQYNHIIHELPGYGNIQGYKIPFWDECLRIATECQHITKLGYLGVDIAIDKSGPMLLEINARPGLKVQVANLVPLRRRLERVKGLKVKSVDHGIQISKALFGRKLLKDIKSLSGKSVIGTQEYIYMYLNNEPHRILAHIDPSREESAIAPALYSTLAKEYPSIDSGRDGLKIRYRLLDKKSQTIFRKGDKKQQADIILGKRDLGQSLVDPHKYRSGELPEEHEEQEVRHDTVRKKVKKSNIIKQWKHIDEELGRIEKATLKHFSMFPLNFEDEMATFVKEKGKYNPQFHYKYNAEMYTELMRSLDSLSIEEGSPQGHIFSKKRDELAMRLQLFHHAGLDAKKFTTISKQLYTSPKKKLLEEAKAVQEEYEKRKHHIAEGKKLTAEETKERLQEYLMRNKLQHWHVVIRETGSTRISIGKSKRRNIYLLANSLFPEVDLESIFAHEVATHAMRLENGIHQPYTVMMYGTHQYLETEEGLAIFNQLKFQDKLSSKFYSAARGYVKTAEVLETSFAEASELESVLQFLKKRKLSDENLRILFRKIYRVKRGIGDTSKPGGFTKDLVYFSGLKKVEKFLKQGGDIHELYKGKIGIQDVQHTKHMEELIQPTHLPHFYADV